MNRLTKYIWIIMLATLCHTNSQAQDSTRITLNIPPLFEYPSAPEELSNLTDRSNYLVTHFWDKFNFKNKKSVDQNALNHAFSVYTIPMQWAHKDKSLLSVEKLISKIQNNPVLLLQMTKAAEENVYGKRAHMFIDEIYIPFLEALVKNKKISNLYKERYGEQLKKLKQSGEGKEAPTFMYINRDGEEKLYKPSGNYTLIEFGDPGCYECRMAARHFEANAAIDELVRTGKLNICFIIPSESNDWKKETEGYPQNWIIGSSDTVDDIYDIRISPTIYIVGPDKKIIKKNISADDAIDTIKELCK